MTSTVANAMDKLYPISAAATYGTGPTAGSESVNKARSVADKVRGLENVDSVAVASAAGTVDFTVPQKDGGEAQNRTENLVALSHDDLTKVIPTEGSHQLEDDTVLVSAALYDNAHFNDSTRLKARGPLGTVELKPIKSTSNNMSLYIVNPTTGAKLQNASDPKPLLDSSQAPENTKFLQKLPQMLGSRALLHHRQVGLPVPRLWCSFTPSHRFPQVQTRLFRNSSPRLMTVTNSPVVCRDASNLIRL